MADLHIERAHALGFLAARQVACDWAAQARDTFGMECAYAEGDGLDTVTFYRTGVKGSLLVQADRFVLDAKLGFVLGAFKDRIEAEIVKNLDTLLQPTATASPGGP